MNEIKLLSRKKKSTAFLSILRYDLVLKSYCLIFWFKKKVLEPYMTEPFMEDFDINSLDATNFALEGFLEDLNEESSKIVSVLSE